MFRLIALLILSAVSLLAQNGLSQISMGQFLDGTNQTQAMNSAANWFFVKWVPPSNGTLNKVQWTAVSVNGSPTSRVELLRMQAVAVMTTVTVDTSLDKLTLSNPAFPNGDRVAFTTSTGNANLPAPLTDTTLYYVCNVTSSDFQISTASDCSSIVDITSAGTGTIQVRWVVDVSTTTTAAVANGIVENTSFTASVSAGVHYVFLFRNSHATPASNNWTFRYYITTGPAEATVMGNLSIARASPSWTSLTATTSGTTAGTPGWYGMRVEMSGSVFYGIPLTNSVTTTNIASGDRVQDKVEVGTRYVVPANANYRFKGIGTCLTRQGSPTADVQLRVYTGANGSETLAATSASQSRILYGSGNSACSYFYFSSVVQLSANTVFRVMISPTVTGDTTTNYFSMGIYTIANDANSRTLIMNGAQYAKNADNSVGAGSWSYDNTKFIAFQFLFDDTPFSAPAGGSGGAGNYTFIGN